MYLQRKGRSACLLPTRHSVQLWRPPGANNNSEECKSHSGHAQVHAQIVSTKAPPPWHAPRTGNGMPIDPPSSSDLKSSSLLLEMYLLSEAGRSQRNVFLHPTDRMCLPMLRPIYTQSCGKETPCGKSPSHTRVGSQALLDRLHGFPRGCKRP